MRTVGATMFMVGLGQVMFQLYLLYTAGYWSAFTLADFFGRSSFGYDWYGRLMESVMRAEFSLTMLLVGGLLVLSGPAGQAFRSWHAHRMVEEARRRPAIKQSTVH